MDKATKIKIALLKQGIRQVDIARKLNLSPYTINNVINGHRRSRRVEKELEKILKNTN